MFGFDDAVGYCGGHACFLNERFSKIGDFFLFFQGMLIWVIGQLGFWEKEKGDIVLGR